MIDGSREERLNSFESGAWIREAWKRAPVTFGVAVWRVFGCVYHTQTQSDLERDLERDPIVAAKYKLSVGGGDTLAFRSPVVAAELKLRTEVA